MTPARPSIAGEKKRERRELRYPAFVARHPWSIKDLEGRPDFLLSRKAEQKIRNHCLENPAVEAMGLLIGDVLSSDGGDYAIVLDVVTAPLRATSVHVEFDHDAMDALAESLDSLGRDLLVVGWYHSHPGHGCFLSDTDVATQMNSFSSPLSSALVVDPQALEMCLFRVVDGEAAAFPVAVFSERYEDPFSIPDIVASHGRYAS